MADPFYRPEWHSSAFLARARREPERFDAGAAEALFYAALELRFGIEARIYDYLRATYQSLGRDPESVTGYEVKKLLGALTRAAPSAALSAYLSITNEQS